MSLCSARRLIASAGIVGAAMLALAGSALPVQATSTSTASSGQASPDLPSAGSVGIIPNHNGNCLGLVSTRLGVSAAMETCNSSTVVWTARGLSNNRFELVNVLTPRLCLSVLNNSRQRGAAVINAGCTGNPWERWFVRDSNAGGVELSNDGDGSGLVMHPSGCNSSVGMKIFMNVANQCQADRWR
jgi:Ricin-type beta-trefoil lectin domain-like